MAAYGEVFMATVMAPWFLAPPARDARKIELLMYFRGLYLRGFLIMAPLLIIGGIAGGWLLVVLLVALAVHTAGFARLLMQIRRQRRGT